MSNVTSDIGRFGIVQAAAVEKLRGQQSALVVYVVLATHVNVASGSGWTLSRAQLAEEAGVSLSTLKRALQTLQEEGLISIVHQLSPNGDQGWSRYHLNILVGNGGVTHDPPAHQWTDPGSPVDPPGLTSEPPSTDPSTDTATDPLPPTPHEAIERVLDQAARMVVEQREDQGWRKAGAGAVRATRERLDRSLAEEWLSKGHGEHEVARCLAARDLDPDSHSTPIDYWQPPRPEADEPVSLDRARELLAEGRKQ